MNRERRNKIAEMLEIKPTVQNSEIMERFGISIETVRRDLEFLEKEGVLERVYGGAVKKSFIKSEPLYKRRLDTSRTEKEQISKEAQKYIEENDTIFFDIGTTVGLVAEHIEKSKNITAFTSSLRTAIALTERNFKVFLPGGQLRGDELSLSGSISELNMESFNIDKAFIGAAGIDKDGITDFIDSEAFLRKKIIKNARKVIVVADHTKFSVRAMCNVCAPSEIDVLITDEKASKKILRELENQGVKVIISHTR